MNTPSILGILREMRRPGVIAVSTFIAVIFTLCGGTLKAIFFSYLLFLGVH